jgi:hypothetical protein
MASPQIFLSYRRDDSAGYARAIGDALAQRFGAERVFMDVDDIGAGQPFDRAIADAVGGARVLLVLIGPRWLAAPPGGTGPRLHEAADVVRHEVATGLARGLQVIPLLVDGAVMPGEADLPADLKPLARRQALAIAHTSFPTDLDRLTEALHAMLGTTPPPSGAAQARPARTTRRVFGLFGLFGLFGVFGVATLALVGTIAWQRFGGADRGKAAPAAAGDPSARPDVNGTWDAEVRYPWPNARYGERFVLGGEGRRLHGSASFLRVARGIVDGQIEADGTLQFSTRTQESLGDTQRELTHRYRGRRVGDELRLVLQTEGSASPSGPVEIVARRAP